MFGWLRHHGQYSCNPPYSVFEVIGAPLTRAAKLAIKNLGFMKFETTAEGFQRSGDLFEICISEFVSYEACQCGAATREPEIEIVTPAGAA